jgi:hypothetical protein
MTDAPELLTPADPTDLADALAFALRFDGRKRVHNADDIKKLRPAPDAARVHRHIATAPGAGRLDTVIA